MWLTLSRALLTTIGAEVEEGGLAGPCLQQQRVEIRHSPDIA